MVFAYAARSLFNADRLTFALHFVRCVCGERDGVRLFPDAEWAHFEGGAAADAPPTVPVPGWVPELLQGRYRALTAALPELVQTAQLQARTSHPSGLAWGGRIAPCPLRVILASVRLRPAC